MACYARPAEPNAISRDRRSTSTVQATSPLADAIERIQASRQQGARNLSIEVQTAKLSLLNPAIQDFVPLESAVGGQADFLLPVQFDHPPPAYSNIEPSSVQSNFRLESLQGATISEAARERFMCSPTFVQKHFTKLLFRKLLASYKGDRFQAREWNRITLSFTFNQNYTTKLTFPVRLLIA